MKIYSVYIINILGNPHNTKWHGKKEWLYTINQMKKYFIYSHFNFHVRKLVNKIRQWTYVSVKKKHNANNIKILKIDKENLE